MSKKRLKEKEIAVETTEPLFTSDKKVPVPKKVPTKYDELQSELDLLKLTVVTLKAQLNGLIKFTTPKLDLNFKKLDEHAVIPTYITEHSAGMDLTAIDVEYDEETDTYCYHTGLAVEIPVGCVGLLFPKSGIYKKTLSLKNCVGVVDSDYRGEIMLRFKGDGEHYDILQRNRSIFSFLFKNLKPRPYDVSDKVAQMIVVKLPDVYIHEVENLSETERGVKGFGEMDNQTLTETKTVNEQ